MDTVLFPDLRERKVLLAVCGGIAAYKSAELCRLLVRCGAQVQVVMTRAAQEFVGQATFAAISGKAVGTTLFDSQQEAEIGHIKAADEAELLLVAPATANLVAQFANGLASDLLTTLYLAYVGPTLLAPAMNARMWAHPATQQNIETLRGRGVRLVGPSSGEMACGHRGVGRMMEPQQILQAAGAVLTPQRLAGRRLVVSAGATREALDPVRFLSNRSTGKMGYAVAAAAAAQGAAVDLVAGPSALEVPYGATLHRVTSAADMALELKRLAGGADAVIMAAAVADYRPGETAASKLKKGDLGERATITLERTEDILRGLVERRKGGSTPRPLLVGFAAETASDPSALLELARHKLRAKGCDLLVANDVSATGAGFGSDTNRVLILDERGNPEQHELMGKRQVADHIMERVCALLERIDDRD